MADERGAKPKVEFKVELEDAGEKDAGQQPPADAPGDGAASGEPASDGLGRVRDWVRRAFPGGQAIDGDPKIWNLIRSLFSRNQ